MLNSGTIFNLIPSLIDPDAHPVRSATKTGDGDGVGKGRDSKSSSGIAIPTRSKKVIPQSQRILHSATRESRAAAAAASSATTTATKHSTRRASTVKTTLPVSKARTTRSATLRQVRQSKIKIVIVVVVVVAVVVLSLIHI